MTAKLTPSTPLQNRLFNSYLPRDFATKSIPLVVLHESSVESDHAPYYRAIAINFIFYTFLCSQNTPEWYDLSTNTIDLTQLKQTMPKCSQSPTLLQVIDGIFTRSGALNLKDMHLLSSKNIAQVLIDSNLSKYPDERYTHPPFAEKEIFYEGDIRYIKEVVFDQKSKGLVLKKKTLNASGDYQRSYKLLNNCPECSKKPYSFTSLIPLYVQENHFKGKKFTFLDFKTFLDTPENKELRDLFIHSVFQTGIPIDNAAVNEKNGMVRAPSRDGIFRLAASLTINSIKYCAYSVALFFLELFDI